MSSRKAHRACSVALCLAFASLALGTPAAAVTLIGVETVELSWSAASGNPPQYAVWLSRNGAEFKPHALVDGTRVALSVSPGDQLSIYVQGVRRHPAGGYEVGPASAASEVLSIFASPQLPVDGSWVLHCSTCGRVEFRQLEDASVRIEQYGFRGSWRVIGRSLLDVGTRMLAWYREDLSWMAFTDAEDLDADPIGPIWVPAASDVALIDYDHDGVDELLFRDRWTDGRIEIWMLDGQELAHVVDIPVPRGTELGPVADYNGDGRDDLLLFDVNQYKVLIFDLDDYDASTGRWSFRDSYAVATTFSAGLELVAAADFDGDDAVDLLWRTADGLLGVAHLDGPRLKSAVLLPGQRANDNMSVVGTVDADGIPGDEIALRDDDTGRVWLLYPRELDFPVRTPVFDAGVGWDVVDVSR